MKKFVLLGFTLFSAVALARNPFLSAEFQQLLQQAEQNPVQQFEVGKRYYMGDGVPSDKQVAIDWLEKAANARYVPAQKALGLIYLDGDGEIGADTAKGLAWLTKAAEKNDGEAIIQLITLYKEGKIVPQDYQKAATFAERGAAIGNASAQYQLATMYHFGLGKTKDLSIAAKLYTQAANQGNLDALNNIGSMYFAGVGVKQDKVMGYTYWLLAKHLGSVAASQNIALKEQVPEISEADKRKARQAVQNLLTQMKNNMK